MLSVLKDISIYAIGDVFTKGIGFVAIIIYSHFISQADMGAYGYIMIVVSFANAFLILGADNAYARYFFEFKEYRQKQVLTTTLFTCLSLWMFVVLFFPILFSFRIASLLLETDKYQIAFCFSLISLPLTLLSSMVNQALRNQFATKKFIILNFFTVLTTLIFAILLLNFTSLGIAAIFLGMILGQLTILPFRIFSIRGLFIKQIDIDILKKMIAYGVPFLPASVAYWVFSSADRVMLESMSHLESVGVYTVAVSLSAVMTLIAGAVGQAWSPHAVKVFEENREKARNLYARFLKFLIWLSLLLIFSASMLGKELITIIFPENYSDVFYPMLLLLTGIGFQITTQVTAAGISLAKRTIYFVYITFAVALINILLNYMFIPHYAELGASFATMISYLVLTYIYAVVSQKLFAIRYDAKFLLLSTVALVFILLASFLQFPYRLTILFLMLAIIVVKKSTLLEFIK